ncbi:MAG: MerR family transcriptional regulator [Thermoanaerobaculia bacterium]
MAAKARIQKRLYYKIGEACKALGIQPYVLRYWETEFPALTPSKSRSGQRVYSEKELEIIRRIKELLYEEGYTIAGAKKKLETELASGALGEPDGEGEETGSGEPAPAAKPAKAPRAAKPRPAGEEAEEPPPSLFSDPEPREDEPGPALDTGGAERVQRLLSGIEEALQEARDLLARLGPKSP